MEQVKWTHTHVCGKYYTSWNSKQLNHKNEKSSSSSYLSNKTLSLWTHNIILIFLSSHKAHTTTVLLVQANTHTDEPCCSRWCLLFRCLSSWQKSGFLIEIETLAYLIHGYVHFNLHSFADSFFYSLLLNAMHPLVPHTHIPPVDIIERERSQPAEYYANDGNHYTFILNCTCFALSLKGCNLW